MASEDVDMEMKITAHLITNDGVGFQTAKDVIELSDVLSNMVDFSKTEEDEIHLEKISSAVWQKILLWVDYDQHSLPIEEHKFKKRSYRHIMSTWEINFLNVDDSFLFEILLASHFLNIKRLYDLMCRAVARRIKFLEPYQIRELYALQKDTREPDDVLLNDEALWAFHAPEAPYVGKPCKLNDPNINDCIVRTGAPIIKRISQGDPKYRIPRLEPLTIPEMRIEQGNRQIGLTMQCKNCQLHGLSDVKFVASRADINKHHVEWDFALDKLMFLGKYKVTGQVLVLPITGDGNANITLSKVKFTFIYDFDLEKRANGREYCIIRNTTLPYSLGGLKIKLDNLFNGDKLLGENMNRFLNENWKELVKEIGPSVADALSNVFTNTMGSMADLVPYDNMFPPN